MGSDLALPEAGWPNTKNLLKKPSIKPSQPGRCQVDMGIACCAQPMMPVDNLIKGE
jgi:hypothetical protein